MFLMLWMIEFSIPMYGNSKDHPRLMSRSSLVQQEPGATSPKHPVSGNEKVKQGHEYLNAELARSLVGTGSRQHCQ